MAAGEFRLGDVFTGEEFDEGAAKREAGRFLERWTEEDFTTAAGRTRRLAILGGAGVVVAMLLPTVSGLADLILEVAFYALLVGVGAATTVHYLVLESLRPADILETDLDAVETVGLLVVLVLAYSATNARAGRLVWRFVFRSAAFAPGGRPPRLEDDDSGAYLTWARRIAGAAAVVVVADVTWFLVTRTSVGPAVYGLLAGADPGGGPSVDLGSGLTTVEMAVLYGVLFIVGVLVAVSVKVRQ